ncbi:uncharacterized protein BX664DRAFT_324146 [Halteromyces radiatus]|uniref:uncharacterized protein n=1 Tax=Halteromyces radiatus TaxID=101107 RepID=UPI00221FA88A|nr:uncharacterized protein BX664DRAFT_324146 [Halteromyces radiatus]KAI8096503.1 hypothetical protein BX664DRAFT_324146 [Halteromyces radiatus]
MMQFNSANLTDNVFLLVTSVFSLAAWVISFGGLCALRVLGSSWWIMIFELLLVVGIIFLILTDSFAQYRLVVLAFLAVSISYLTGELTLGINLTNGSVGYYNRGGAGGAYVAGYIILVIIHIVWVFVFGSEPHSYFGQFAQHGRNSVQQQPHVNSIPPAAPNNNNTNIEMTQDKTAYEGGAPPANQSPALTHPSMATSPVLEYSERVEALHEYRANPEDPSELSFERGDILEIVDRRGNWWQARKADGTTGIIPSNYFA